MIDFKNKVTLVTGAADGLGKVIAQSFAAYGSKVVVADINDELGAKTIAEIRSKGGEAEYFHTDVSNVDQVKALVNFTMDTYGRLDCAINNAGISMHPTILHEIEDSMMDRVIGVNLKSIFYCMKYEIIEMLKTGGGAIVNMSSVGGLLGTPGQSMYNTTKHGILGMTKAAAVEYAKKGLQINAICPGAVKTAIWEASGLLEKIEANIPAGKAAEAQDIANIALFLCSNAAPSIMGAAIVSDNCQSIYLP